MTGDKTGTPRGSFQQEQEQEQEQKRKQSPEHHSWLSRCRKNKPQWNALGAGSLIFVSGGMSLAWGAGFAAQSMHMELLTLTLHMQICWYGAALLGAALSVILTHRTPQRPVYVSIDGLMIGGAAEGTKSIDTMLSIGVQLMPGADLWCALPYAA